MPLSDPESETLPEGALPWGLLEPWTRGGLRFRRAVIEAVAAESLRCAERGEEACGYLSGPGSDPTLVDEHVAMTNLASALHRADPAAWARTARTSFAFSEKTFDEAFIAARFAATPIKVLYHSHVDVGAYFSAVDRALMSRGELPAPPEGVTGVGGDASKLGPGPKWALAFLVSSVRGVVVEEHKLFVWSGSDFVESVYEIV